MIDVKIRNLTPRIFVFVFLVTLFSAADAELQRKVVAEPVLTRGGDTIKDLQVKVRTDVSNLQANRSFKVIAESTNLFFFYLFSLSETERNAARLEFPRSDPRCAIPNPTSKYSVPEPVLRDGKVVKEVFSSDAATTVRFFWIASRDPLVLGHSVVNRLMKAHDAEFPEFILDGVSNSVGRLPRSPREYDFGVLDVPIEGIFPLSFDDNDESVDVDISVGGDHIYKLGESILLDFKVTRDGWLHIFYRDNGGYAAYQGALSVKRGEIVPLQQEAIEPLGYTEIYAVYSVKREEVPEFMNRELTRGIGSPGRNRNIGYLKVTVE